MRLREWPQIAWTLEWVATSGASLISATSRNPFSLRCERSTRMPSWLQALTSALPASVRPGPVSGVDGNRNGTPWPKAFGRLQTMPSERKPAACSTSSMVSSGSIASTPSIWNTAAIDPCAIAFRTSPALRQTVSADARSSLNRIEAMAMVEASASARGISGGKGSISLGAGGTALRLDFSTGGGKIANMPPAKPPCFARGRSMWPPDVPSMNSFSTSASFD